AVKRIALGRRRDATRRHAREALAARPEPDRASEDVPERLEVLRALLAAVERLDDPYRAAVVMRYLDDLPPREIARRTGVPVDTARTHVRRGLERLRRDLDGPRGRGREALLGVLGPWFANETAVVVTAASPLVWMGSLAMNHSLSIVLVLLSAVMGWRLLQDPAVTPAAPGNLLVSSARPTPEPAAASDLRSTIAPAPAQEDAQRAPVEASPVYEVSGAILRGYGGNPIPGGHLRLRLRRGVGLAGDVLLERRGQTDAQGEFRFALDPSPETVTVALEPDEPGHYGHPTWIVVPPGDMAWGHWVIHAYPLDVDVSGQVLDARGHAVAGARVVQWVYERDREVRTDPDGRFRMRLSSAAGSVRLRVEAEGHAHAILELQPPEGGSMTLEPVRLTAERLLAGRVVDAQGLPVVGAVVRDRRSLLGTRTISGDDGRFQLGGIAPEHERLLLEVAHAEFALLELEVALPSEPIEVRLDRGVKLIGHARQPSGAPASNTWVRLGSSFGPGMDPGTATDAEGRFVFERVPAGPVHLWWWAQGFATGRCSVEIPLEGPREAAVEFVLEPERVLHGRLLRPDGSPEPWSLVYVEDRRVLRGEPRFESAQVWTDAAGSFAFRGLPSGPMLVGATVRGFERIEMELADVGNEDLELRLRQAGKLAGRVTDAATGAPIPRFRLILRRPTSVPHEEQIGGLSTTWDRGKFIEHPEGEWLVDEDFAAGRWAEVQVEAEGYAPTRVERVATAVDPDPADCVVALVRETLVRGQIVDPDGAPVAGAVVSLVDRKDGPRATTDGAGRFELLGLAAGETTLAVEAEGFARLRDGPFEVGGVPLQHRIQLDRGARVVGRVIGDDGQPMEGQQVSLWGYDGNDRDVSRKTLSDAEGRFAFAGLALGTFDLHWERTLEGETWTAHSRRIDITTLEDVEANLGASGSAVFQATIQSEVALPTGTRVRVMFMAEFDPERMRVGGTKDRRFSVAGSSRMLFVEGDRLEIRGLEPGFYMLAAHAELDPTTTLSGLVRQIEITAGQQVETEVLLKAPAR
ncbi:MAG TPA: carboxypeptidase regulatory-like domain-containing protein, partial [Planctomycetota bacterium]|nr:carboxypeptidase regulatory-like domain-containing protein [Planctomycetota bacterium]